MPGSSGSKESAEKIELVLGQDARALRFSAKTLVQGMVFHLLDEGIAVRVTEDSVSHTVGRLERERVRPTIRKDRWEAMDNPGRLAWLLTATHTETSVRPDRVAVLESKGS